MKLAMAILALALASDARAAEKRRETIFPRPVKAIVGAVKDRIDARRSARQSLQRKVSGCEECQPDRLKMESHLFEGWGDRSNRLLRECGPLGCLPGGNRTR